MALVLLAGTAVAGKKQAPAPAGVDSTTVQQADSLARELFGDQKRFDEARRQFENGKDDFNAGEAFIREADSLRAIGIDTTLRRPGGVFGQIRQALGDTVPSSREQDTRKRAEAAFKRAVREFEQAQKIQPDMQEIPLWLVATYDRLQDWTKSLALYREILNERQGEDRLWFSYGYAALRAGQYDKAVMAFGQAISVHFLVNEDSARIPNRYRAYLGEAYIKTYQDRLALEQFRQAQEYAADTSERAELQRTIDWIQWDEGGIATVEYRDAAFRAETESRWNDAREAYLGGIQASRSPAARNELSYRLTLLEFRQSSKSDALARMKSLIDGTPDASDEWRENYGKMLYAYAQETEQGGDTRGALGYYLQATKFPWSGQGVGYLEIARVAANDLDQAIEHATHALEFPLSAEQRQAAYKRLEEAYRSKGNWDKMKYYRRLQEGGPVEEGEAKR
ncbi:hypothetical protein HZB60_10340 [candidate division KSB1 bacterium]|nr:hypothetical protein [candidate division KSB1 bacterium]